MIQGVSIFWQAVSHFFRNFGTALRLTAVIWIAMILLDVAASYLLVGHLATIGGVLPDAEGQYPALMYTYTLYSIAVRFVGVVLVAIVWHRFGLLGEEHPGWLPKLDGLPIVPYMVASMKMLLLLALCIGPLIFLSGLLLPSLPVGLGIGVSALIMACVGIYLMLRFGVMLPAAAGGQPLSFGDAARLSQPLGFALFATVFCFLVLNVLVGIGISLAPSKVAALCVAATLNWVSVMIGVGTLNQIFLRLSDPITNRPNG